MPKNKPKVVLISPPSERLAEAIKEEFLVVAPPLGLASVAAVLQKGGFEVKIIDAIGETLDLKDVILRIKKEKPDFVGLTVFTSLVNMCKKIAQETKKINPRTIIIAGGPHVHFRSEELLKEAPWIDYCVRGEGELTALELLQKLSKKETTDKVLGITYRRNLPAGRHGGKIVKNPDRPLIQNLDDLPFLAVDLLPMQAYRAPQVLDERKPFMMFMPSRGCPFHCHYCAASAVLGHQRRQTPKRFLDEVENVYNKYHIRAMRLEDDLFTLNRAWAKEVCEGFIKRGLSQKIIWEANGRFNTLTPDLLSMMKKAGCRSVAMGIEFGNQRILDFCKKGFRVQDIGKTVRMIKDAGLRTKGYFMIGYPTETRETIMNTIRLSQKLPFDYAVFSLATPFPGTALYEYAKEHNLIKSENWDHYQFGPVERPLKPPDGLSEEELLELYEQAVHSFYYRPSQILKVIRLHPKFVLEFALAKVKKFFHA